MDGRSGLEGSAHCPCSQKPSTPLRSRAVDTFKVASEAKPLVISTEPWDDDSSFE